MRSLSRSGQPRIVSIDVGTKRVGVAVSDPLRLFAQPLGAFSPDETLRVLTRLAGDVGIDRLVVGWPLTLEDTEEEAVAFVRAYVSRVEKVLPGIPWTAWDERFTTQEARALICKSGAKRKSRRDKGRVDAASAALILQEFLDESERPPG